MFLPLKKLVQSNAIYTAALLLILLVMKNILRPYSGYQSKAIFEWYDILLIVVVMVAGATSAVSAYRFSLQTAHSLYAAAKTGLYSVMYTALVLVLVALALPMILTQDYLSQLIPSVSEGSRIFSLLVFNLMATLALSALGAIIGLIGGLFGWVFGVLTVHGIIARDYTPEPTDDVLLNQAVTEPSYVYENATPLTEEAPTVLEDTPDSTTSTTAQFITIPVSDGLDERMPQQETNTTPMTEQTMHATPLHIDPTTEENMTPLHFIHFIPEHDLQSLYAVGISHIETFLQHVNTPQERESLAAQTQIAEGDLLTYANVADLMRLPGVDSVLGQLLEKSGVDTIVELGKRNPQKLHEAVVSTNEREAYIHQVPTVDQLRGLINAAKILGREITH
jgi:hypothetical protein